MKKFTVFCLAELLLPALLLISCSTPIGLTSWKNPEGTAKVSKIVVMATFDKMSAIEPVEQQSVNYFTAHNLPSVKALDIMNPFQEYKEDELKEKLSGVGADGFLLIAYKSTDVEQNYNPGGYYGGYRGFYAEPGSWSTSKTFYLRAMLYEVSNNVLLWSGDLSITDPTDINSAAQQVAQVMFNDWVAKQLLKNPPPAGKK